MTIAETIETVQHRVAAVVSKAEQVGELHNEVQRIETKRTEAANKNSGFQALEKKISHVHEQHGKLKQWVQCADSMSVSINRTNIRAEIDDVSRDIETLLEAEYDDFNDRSEIDNQIEVFEGHRNTLRECTETVKIAVQEKADSERQTVDRIRSLLQIPDIGTADDSTLCENYRYYLQELKKGNVQKVDLDRLVGYKREFHSLDIGLGDDLSDDAKDVIWNILENETITLADISSEVLSDLKQFEEFSNRLLVEFTESR
ncbi:hypothetical protein [Haladaptatus sp. CMSO5]|uniref:hypothetical protein n=1 Tax=Haladaptatus sp. CMSO5 TaxID=3120514 RepID=UPI002FCE0E21